MSAQSQSDLLHFLVEALPFGVYVLDATGRIVIWNKAAERITGHLAQAVTGRLFDEDLLVSSDMEPTSRNLEIRREGGELFIRHAEGHRVPVLARSLVLRDEEGIAMGSARMFMDEHTGNEGLCWMSTAEIRLDPELGIPSQSASQEQLRVFLSQDDDLAVFRVKVKGLNDYVKRYGSEMVHVTLRTLGQTISHILTVPHFCGCWANHEFLVLVPECDEEVLSRISDKLKNVGKACRIVWWGDRVIPDLDVAALLVSPSETTEAVLARLEGQEESGDGAGEENKCS